MNRAMGRLMMILWVALASLVVAMGYVRLAPSDPARWDVAVEADRDRDFVNGAVRLVDTGADGLSRLHPIALATPRTTVLAGSVAAGRVTYVTRSVVWGFPDYTTVQQQGDQLAIYARSRFGRSDLGVNRARVESWLTALQAR